ncbi:hypothetical protein [Methanosarcina siciliae]|nr:hypothetical protein [Methanosarcina siciliae]
MYNGVNGFDEEERKFWRQIFEKSPVLQQAFKSEMQEFFSSSIA